MVELYTRVWKEALIVFIYMIHAFTAKTVYENVYGSLGTNVVLSCPYISKYFPTKWLGPPNLTVYTYKTSITASLQHFERLQTVGNHSIGEYNLEIKNMSYVDAGFYRCLSVQGNTPITYNFKLNIYSKPHTRVKDNENTFKTTINYPANVSIMVDSYDIPVALWTSGSGGTLGIWDVVKLKNATVFVLRSTIVPESYEHFGDYGLRIRNNAGSVDLFINVELSDLPISSTQSDVHCNVSSTAKLYCSINLKHHTNWTCVWKHYVGNVLLRSIAGTNMNNRTLLYIPHCNPLDEGEYQCILMVNDVEFKAYTNLTVNGPPLVGNKSTSFDQNMLYLSVAFRTTSAQNTPVWFYRKLDTEEKVNTDGNIYNQSMDVTPVEIVMYNVRVVLPGYTLSLTANLSDDNVKGTFICQLRNAYGAVEISFPMSDAIYDRNSRTTEIHGVLTTSEDEHVKPISMLVKYRLLLILVCAVGLVMAVILFSIITTQKFTKRRRIILTVSERQVDTHSVENVTRISSQLSLAYSEVRNNIEPNDVYRGTTISSRTSSSGYEVPDSPLMVTHSYESTDMTKAEIHHYDQCINSECTKDGNSRDCSSYSLPGHPYLVLLESCGIVETLINDNVDSKICPLYRTKRSQSV